MRLNNPCQRLQKKQQKKPFQKSKRQNFKPLPKSRHVFGVFPREGEETHIAFHGSGNFLETRPRPNLTDWSDLNAGGRQFNTV